MSRASDELGSAAEKLNLASELLKDWEDRAPEVDLLREEVVDVQARVERLRLALGKSGQTRPDPQDEAKLGDG